MVVFFLGQLVLWPMAVVCASKMDETCVAFSLMVELLAGEMRPLMGGADGTKRLFVVFP